MKISKLFHWLYALVMLLPIFAIGTTCLISTFNMSSKQESEIHYKYETNEVTSNAELIQGNIYRFNYRDFAYDNDFNLFTYSDFNTNYYANLYFFVSNEYTYTFENQIISIDDLSFPIENNIFNFYAILYNNSINYSFYYGWFDNIMIVDYDDFTDDFDDSLIVTKKDTNQVVEYIEFVYKFENNGIYLANNFWEYIRPVPISEIPIDYVETHNVNAEEVFYRSVDKVVQSPLFNWAYNSNLLGVPVSYIGGIFGLASNSVINVLLCYWLAFSIIWLVFDILMFVPLLVHKSIDKMRF